MGCGLLLLELGCTAAFLPPERWGPWAFQLFPSGSTHSTCWWTIHLRKPNRRFRSPALLGWVTRQSSLYGDRERRGRQTPEKRGPWVSASSLCLLPRAAGPEPFGSSSGAGGEEREGRRGGEGASSGQATAGALMGSSGSWSQSMALPEGRKDEISEGPDLGVGEGRVGE